MDIVNGAAYLFEKAAFHELEKMLVPISLELDYDKELAEARNEKYGYID